MSEVLANSDSISVSLGVFVGKSGGSTGLGIEGAASVGKGHSNSDSQVQNHTEINADRLTMKANETTTLEGATANVNHLALDTKNLHIESVQDIEKYDSKQTQGGVKAAFAWGSGASGSAQFSRNKANVDYAQVNQQSGFNISESSNINVEENTHLKGGGINAQGDKANHNLTTGTLTTESIENRSDIKVSSVSAGVSSDMTQMATMAVGAALSALGNTNESERSQTQAAISSNINVQITDSEKQKSLTGKTAEETLRSLNRDVANANQKLEKQDLQALQERQEMAQVIGELSQAGINHLVGDKLKEANKKRQEADAIEKENPTKATALRAQAQAIEAEYGLGSNLQMGVRAATAALQGLATGSVNQAAVGAVSPYLNKLTKEQTGDNKEANLIAHAVLGAVEAHVTGNNAAVGALGALTAEAAAPLIMQTLYGTEKPENLTDSQKQNVANLSQIAAGLSGGLVGDSTGSFVAGAEIGKRAVENNYLYVDEAKEKMVLERKVKAGEATEEEKQRLAQINLIDIVRDQDIVDACEFVSSTACLELTAKAEYAQYGYEQNLSYNTKLKELYPNDYQNVLNILSGKDQKAVEFEKIALGISKQQNISLDEAKNFLEKVMIYKEFAELIGAVRGGTAVKYKVIPKDASKITSPPVNYEKVVFNGIELHPNLPPPKAGYDFEPQKAKGNSIYQQTKDINGYRGEIVLANNIAETGRTVIKWGNSTGTHGSDIISINPRTGEVELWDSKYRSGSATGKISPTFDKSTTRSSAIEEAIGELEQARNIAPEIRDKAISNLNKGNFTTYTVGSGKVKNSVIQRFCNYERCSN